MRTTGYCNKLHWVQISQVPSKHWTRHLESGRALSTVITSSTNFISKNFDVAKWGLNGECLSVCRAIWWGLWIVETWLDTRGTWPGRVTGWPHRVTWHVTMLPSRQLINGCQYTRSASDQARWHEDWNCLMHSSLEMHWTCGNSDWNSSRIWSPQLIHWSCSHSPVCTWTQGGQETINQVPKLSHSPTLLSHKFEIWTGPAELPITKVMNDAHPSCCAPRSLNRALCILTDYFGRV